LPQNVFSSSISALRFSLLGVDTRDLGWRIPAVLLLLHQFEIGFRRCQLIFRLFYFAWRSRAVLLQTPQSLEIALRRVAPSPRLYQLRPEG
jgi:hypothetical protein